MYNKPISLIVMLILVLGYWLYIWQFERINYSQAPPAWWNAVLVRYPLFEIISRLFLSIVELLSPRVLRHFIPLVAGAWMARIAISRFLESFYDLPDQSVAKSLLSRLLAGGIPGRSVGSINHRNFKEQLEKNPQLRIGGPGYLYVEPGTVALTERNGRCSQALGPGNHPLGRFEYPAAVLDIRPQEREATSVKMVTSDGIDLTVDVSVTFQVGRGGQEPSRVNPFPFDPSAARKAAYVETNLSDERTIAWDTLTLFNTAAELRNLVAESRLDELIHTKQSGIHPHPRLKRAMEQRARQVMREIGVDVRDSRLGRFELPYPVVLQNINYWHAQWESARDLQQPESDKQIVNDADGARTNALTELAQAYVDRFESTQVPIGEAERKPIWALHAVVAMEALISQESSKSPAAQRQLTTLADLKRQMHIEYGISSDNFD